jgi:muramoyltetrapeptide carboxypeptidase LdcA involved in peptidoglycan recycling
MLPVLILKKSLLSVQSCADFRAIHGPTQSVYIFNPVIIDMAIIPERLKRGDEIRVIAPARSIKLPFITKAIVDRAVKNLNSMGLKVSFGKHVNEMDEFGSSTVEHRLEDLHDAFEDTDVKAVMAVIGGYNSNQLLEEIDYGLIKKNPKVFVGYSDITALQNAVFKKTGLVCYSGPNFFNFGYRHDFGYTMDYFSRCLFGSDPFTIKPAEAVSEWSHSKEKDISYRGDGNWRLQEGRARGTVIGANLCTLNLLQGTEFMPSLKGCILFVEDDRESGFGNFDRDLQSLLQLPDAEGVRGVAVGRFQEDSRIPRKMLERIVGTKRALEGVPVLANVDFGHTYPLITFPVGGEASLIVGKDESELSILKH